MVIVQYDTQYMGKVFSIQKKMFFHFVDITPNWGKKEKEKLEKHNFLALCMFRFYLNSPGGFCLQCPDCPSLPNTHIYQFMVK